MWGEVPQGSRVPEEGSRGPADLLRLPGRALGSLANLEPHRKRVRDRAAQDRQNQGIAVVLHGPADGLQTCDGRRENLAKAERRKPVAEGRSRCHLPRRDGGHRRSVKPRRLIAPSSKLHHSSARVERTFIRVGEGMDQSSATEDGLEYVQHHALMTHHCTTTPPTPL